MDGKKGTQTDRQTGAVLDQDTVERMRRGIVWMQKNRGLRLKDVAVGCDVAEHTVRNFAYGKAARPDNTFLGRLFRYLADYREAMPKELTWNLQISVGIPTRRQVTLPMRYESVRLEVQVDEADLLRVYERYAGYYLCFSRSRRADHLVVSWLHVRARHLGTRNAGDGLLMPRFTFYSRNPDRFDVDHVDDYVVAGYVITRHGSIFFTGQHDGELSYMILKEPPVRKFTYLEGLCLFTSADARAPFAARIMCQPLGPRVLRDAWQNRIGLFTLEDFRLHFDNADVIERALGERGLSLGNEAS